MEQEEFLTFLKSLRLETALVVYDVWKGCIDETTQSIADSVEGTDSDDELIQAILGGNLQKKESLADYCKVIIGEMFDKFKLQEGLK